MATKKSVARSISGDVAGDILSGSRKPKTGKASGCRDGEERCTIILGKAEIQLLKLFAWNIGRTWRELAGDMARRYIKDVIHPYVKNNGKLRAKPGEEPPRKYAEYFTDTVIPSITDIDNYAE